jgi:hypothetical protein
MGPDAGRIQLLFTDRSISTMVHGVVLGGAALMALSAALFHLYAARAHDSADAAPGGQARALAGLTVFAAAVLWLAVLGGTYLVFPLYRATPPAGLTDLSQYPRSLIESRPDTVWLHAFAMEIKEHAPWIASMLATAVAFVCVFYRRTLLRDASLRNMTATLLAVCLALVAFVALMGTFINKVAPVE